MHTALAPVDRNPDPIVPIRHPTSKSERKYAGRGEVRGEQPFPATSAGRPEMSRERYPTGEWGLEPQHG